MPTPSLAELRQQYADQTRSMNEMRDRLLNADQHPGNIPTDAEVNEALVARNLTSGLIRDAEREAEGRQPTTEIRMGTTGTGLQSTTSARPGEWVREDGRSAALTRGQSFRDHPVVQSQIERGGDRHVTDMHENVGSYVRSLSTGGSPGVIPTLWAADIIDKARNYAAVLQAGTTVVPMDAKIVQIGRLTTDPTAAFRAEGSTITASDPAFDYIQLTATTMSALVVASVEFVQDAVDSPDLVTEAIGKAMGLQLDLVCLFGSLTTGGEGFNLPTPNNPRGVLGNLLANASTSVLGSGTNGTAQTALSYWNELLDTIYTPRDNNETPNAYIWNSKLARQYAKAYDSQGRILQRPPDLDALQGFVSNQIPSFTQGTMTSRATDFFVGDWSQALLGQRLDISLQVLDQRYAELGQVAFLATWRGDFQLARPKAFAVYRYLQGA